MRVGPPTSHKWRRDFRWISRMQRLVLLLLTLVSLVGASAALAAYGPLPGAPPRPIGIVVQSGAAVQLGQKIETPAGRGLQVLLDDETLLTLGPQTILAIDEFALGVEGGRGRLTAIVSRGAVRFTSGRVPQSAPDAMRLVTPMATFGVRSAAGAVLVTATSATGFLLGTGVEAEAGGIAVSSNAVRNAAPIVVTGVGFSTTVGLNQPPTQPADDRSLLQELVRALSGRDRRAMGA
jgi:hypothetical protein